MRPVPSRGCRDHRATRRALMGRAAEVVPVPADALDGLASFERAGGMTRRDLLERGVGLWVGATAIAGLTTRGLLEAASAQAQSAPGATILVSLYLDGGNDGLNTLVPLADPRYRQLRTRLGVAPETTLPLAGRPRVRLAPRRRRAAGALRPGQGRRPALGGLRRRRPVALQLGGLLAPGHRGALPVTTGWLGRTIDVVGALDNPLQGISVSSSPDPVLDSARAPTATVYDPNGFSFGIEGVWRPEGFMRAYRDASRGRTGSAALAAARRTYDNAFRVQERLAPLRVDADDPPLPPAPVDYPDSDLGSALENLARMLGAGFGTRVAALSAGGFDTHDAQDAEHPALLKDLGDSLWAWQADLAARGLSGRVLTLVWSEFGRRPEDNDSQGTDHGAGGLVMVVGDRVNGGIRSEFPGLARLDEDDNLLVTTEFRTVYASLLEGWLGVEAGRVLPGIDAARIPLVR